MDLNQHQAQTKKDLPSMAKSIDKMEDLKRETGLTLGELEDKVLSLREESEQLTPVSKESEAKEKELTKIKRDRDILVGEIKELSERKVVFSYSLNDLKVKEVELTNI